MLKVYKIFKNFFYKYCNYLSNQKTMFFFNYAMQSTEI
jgi:hypothetical protein